MTGTLSSGDKISATVEDQLDRILWQLITGDIELHQLTPALAAWWTLAHESGRQSRQAEIDRLEHTADRLFAAAARGGVPLLDPERPSYSELERLRGNVEHADQIDAANLQRFAEVR